MKQKWEDPEYRKKASESMKENHANFKGGLHPQAKSVYCIEKGVEMPSCRDMAEYLQCKNPVTGAKGIARVCRKERITYNNLHFVWASEKNNTEVLVQISEKEQNRGFHAGTLVKCVETGIIYESCAAAARSVNGDRSNIRDALDKQNRTAYGYHWITIIE